MKILKFFVSIWAGACLGPKIRFDVGTALGTFVDERGLEASFINRGSENSGRENITIERFYGIPYAKPPVGELRWKVTEEMESWEEEIDATNKSSVPLCAQLANPNMKMFMSEDCLTLNIYRPINGQNLPILIYFHDGQFQIGSSQYIDGSILSHVGKMIVVTVQYRLNIFGFLSLNSKSEKIGNFGLHDQQMAIKFIHRNAYMIGGNSNMITIAGIEAGGSSVGHLLKSESRALIGGAISMMGVGNFANFEPNVEIMEQKLRNLCNMTLKVEQCQAEDVRQVLATFGNLTTSDILALGALTNEPFLPRKDESFFINKPSGNNSISYMIVTTSADGPVSQPEYKPDGHSVCSIYDILNQLRVYQPTGPVAAAVGDSDQLNYFIVKNYLNFYAGQFDPTPTDVDQLHSDQSYEIMRRLMTDILYRVPALTMADEYSAIKDTVKLLYLDTPDFFDQDKYVPISLLLFGTLFNPMDQYRGWESPSKSDIGLTSLFLNSIQQFVRTGGKSDASWPNFGNKQFQLTLRENATEERIEMALSEYPNDYPELAFWTQDWTQIRKNDSLFREPICEPITTASDEIPTGIPVGTPRPPVRTLPTVKTEVTEPTGDPVQATFPELLTDIPVFSTAPEVNITPGSNITSDSLADVTTVASMTTSGVSVIHLSIAVICFALL